MTGNHMLLSELFDAAYRAMRKANPVESMQIDRKVILETVDLAISKVEAEALEALRSPSLMLRGGIEDVVHAVVHRTPVEIVESDECGGPPLWVIRLVQDPEMWLQSFDSEQEARKFCAAVGLHEGGKDA